MKGANLLIFRDQRVKLGDLGISVKLEKNDDPNAGQYYIKGVTAGYVTAEVQSISDNDFAASRKQLFNNDKYALIVTFTKALDSCKKLIKNHMETSKQT